MGVKITRGHKDSLPLYVETVGGGVSGGATEAKQDDIIADTDALQDALAPSGTWVQNLSFTEALVVAGEHSVRRVKVYNSSNNDRFLQFHDDADGTITDATTPSRQVFVPGKSEVYLGTNEIDATWFAASNGISITQSTIRD